MGSRERPFFDLNEPPAVDEDDKDDSFCFQPQKTLPSTNLRAPDLNVASVGPQGIVNNQAFSHASSISRFQPFVRAKTTYIPDEDAELMGAGDQKTNDCSSTRNSKDEDKRVVEPKAKDSSQIGDREEGEWSDAEGSSDMNGCNNLLQQSKIVDEQALSGMAEGCVAVEVDNNANNIKAFDRGSAEKSNHAYIDGESGSNEQKVNVINAECSIKGVPSSNAPDEPSTIPKQKEVKGIEAIQALRCANNPGKRKMDQRKEEMLGKKRNRQIVVLNLEDAMQAGPIKTSTPRRQTSSSSALNRVKEVRNIAAPTDRVAIVKDQKPVDTSSSEGGTHTDACEPKTDCNGDNSEILALSTRQNNDHVHSSEVNLNSVSRQSLWKQPNDLRPPKNVPVSNKKLVLSGQSSGEMKPGNKKHFSSKKQTPVTILSQDTSVERLIREVTSEKFWHHPGIKQLNI